MATTWRIPTAGILILLSLATVLVGQVQPKSFKELRAQIDAAKNTRELIASINLVYKFRSSGSREFLCKSLDIYRDPAVRSAVFRQLIHHPHADVFARLQKEFRTSKIKMELDGIVVGLSGQGRRGLALLKSGLSSKDQLIRTRSIAGLRRMPDLKGATAALMVAFAKTDTSTKILVLDAMVAINSKGGSADDVERLVFKILAKESNIDLRMAALRSLRGKPGKRALAFLKKEFEVRKSARLVREAAQGLVTLNRPGLSVLIKGLQSGIAGRRDAAVSALGGAGKDRKATMALIEHFENANTRQQEVILGVLGRHETIPPLTFLRLSALASKSAKIRAEALCQLADTGHRRVAAKALEFANDKEILKLDRPAAQVFYSMGRVLTRAMLPSFLELGRKRGWILDSHWARLLVVNEKKVLPLVAGPALALESPELRLVATHLLARVKSKIVKSQDIVANGLIKALRDKSPIVVVTAMRALIRQQNKRVIPTLEANLDSMDEDVRVQAMLGLHQFKGKSVSWGARLLKILRNTSGASRLIALDLVTKMKLRPALSAVRALFDHETWQVRSAAYFFCLQVRDKESIAPLIARLEKEDGRLRSEVLGTLRALTDLTYREPKQWRSWWVKNGKTFEMPALAKKAGVGRSAPAVMTYYSMSLNSNRVCFLVDTSGSMQAKVGTSKITRLDLAKKALNQVIEKCGEGFHFNLITFDSEARRWKRELCPASIDNKDSAKQYVKGMRPNGATNFFEALLMAFEDESIDTIYLLSDGTPTVGDITNQQELGDEIQRWNAKRLILIHTISIGDDSSIMKRLAEDSGGDHVLRR